MENITKADAIKLPLEHIGTAIKGLRLGYYWSEDHQCFIRIRAGKHAPFTIDIAPADQIPNDKKFLYYYKWHENPRVLNYFKRIFEKLVLPVKQPQTFIQ